MTLRKTDVAAICAIALGATAARLGMVFAGSTVFGYGVSPIKALERNGVPHETAAEVVHGLALVCGVGGAVVACDALFYMLRCGITRPLPSYRERRRLLREQFRASRKAEPRATTTAIDAHPHRDHTGRPDQPTDST